MVGIDWNILARYDNSALVIATRGRHKQHPEILQVMLSQVKNIDVNHLNLPDEDFNDNTPLLLAAKRGNFETLRILIKHPGLRWDLENREGETALSLVLSNEELFLALLKELKIYVSKLMTKRFDNKEVTKGSFQK